MIPQNKYRTGALLFGVMLMSGCVVRTFTDPNGPSDTTAPGAPAIARVEPSVPSPVRNPRVFGQAEPGSHVAIFIDGTCSGTPAGEGSAEEFATIGIEIEVTPNALSQLVAVAVDVTGNISACTPTPTTYTHDDLPPAFTGTLTATPVTPTQVVVSWQPASDAGTAAADLHYELCVAPTQAGACTPFAATHDAKTGSTLWNIGALKEGTSYTVVVRVSDAAGNTTVHTTRVTLQTPTASDAQGVAAGAFHTCALEANETVRCWGWNFDGQLGPTADVERSTTPLIVAGIADAKALVSGGLHACVILGDRSVRCWGDDAHGQRGGSALANGAAPGATVTGLPGTVSLAAGLAHTCALAFDGSVRCWGDNAMGQLGDGTQKRSVAAVRVSGLEGAVALVAGDHHTCALLADGAARCWGGNVSGELGDGTTTSRPVSVKATGVERAMALAAGWGHTCALAAEGAVRCWGKNSDGQLGDGTTETRAAPVAVAGLEGVKAMSAGWNHTCALKVDGSVACFGRNADGQLGDGTERDRGSPAPVQGLSSVVSLSAGESHTCARTDNREVRCWGRNDFGQLGDGTLNGRTIPAAAAR